MQRGNHLAEYKDVPEYHTTGWYDSWGASVANLNYATLPLVLAESAGFPASLRVATIRPRPAVRRVIEPVAVI